MHPYRSVLYLPGSKERVLEKAQALPADSLIIDLEDAVAPAEKNSAREIVVDALNKFDYGSRKILIRVNGDDTEWGAADIQMAIKAAPDGILLPKINTGSQINRLAKQIGDKNIRIWAMMETAMSVINAHDIAQSSELLEGFVLGTNDLAKELRTQTRKAIIPHISQILLAARAENKFCIDGVYNAFKDNEGLREEANEGLEMGMDGKSLIHPAQLEITNQVFAPSSDDVDLAKRQVSAFEEALARGEAVAVVDGKIVENLHVENAKRLIALDASIRALQN